MSDTSGPTSGRQFADYDHESRSWKMWPATGLWGSIAFSETWPKTGCMSDGRAYELPTSVPAMPEIECSSSLLPTPVVTDAAGTRNETAGRSDPNSKHHSGTTLTDAVSLLPTPRGCAERTSHTAATRFDSRSAPSLEQAIEIAAGELPREFDSWEELPTSWQP